MTQIDKGKVLRGQPIVLNEVITIYQHSIGDILDFGEQQFFSTFHTMCSAPWDMPSMLDDMGIDFMDISSWEFFIMMRSLYSKSNTSILLGDLDISTFIPIVVQKEDRQEIILKNEEGLVIDENMYEELISYISEIISYNHKNKKAGNKTTAKILIEEDRRERKRNEKKEKPYESIIYDAVISLVNTEELSYTYETIFNLTLYQFMKSFTQIQGKKSAIALLQGSMSGFCDTSNIPKEDMQWIYSDDKYKPRTRKLVNNKVKTK